VSPLKTRIYNHGSLNFTNNENPNVGPLGAPGETDEKEFFIQNYQESRIYLEVSLSLR
jgi:hypothetical protein